MVQFSASIPVQENNGTNLFIKLMNKHAMPHLL
jgi:hypothetical protein